MGGHVWEQPRRSQLWKQPHWAWQRGTGQARGGTRVVTQGRDRAEYPVRSLACSPLDPEEVVMNHIRRIAVMLAGLALLAS